MPWRGIAGRPIRLKSIDWVRTHDSAKFLESFYFQYGHASIADLGHVVLCFEGVSELAATEIEDEALWDGQARSSRYQDFPEDGVCHASLEFPEVRGGDLLGGGWAPAKLAYREIHVRAEGGASCRAKLPRPEEDQAGRLRPQYSGSGAFRRGAIRIVLRNRPTGVGQVTSVRTLERQIQRVRRFRNMGRSANWRTESRGLARRRRSMSLGRSFGKWNPRWRLPLARRVDPDQHAAQSRVDFAALWAKWEFYLRGRGRRGQSRLDLTRPTDTRMRRVTATLLYPVTDWPFRGYLS